jgi:tryptophan halogenase
MTKNIIIAGAGTAGWLAALHSKKHHPDYNVTVVYDDKTPIIGVGESTTPNFLKFMREEIDIPLKDLIKNCDVTLKNGIKFTNWKGDGSHYYHTFTSDKVEKYFNALATGIHLDEIIKPAVLSKNNKIAHSTDGVEIKENAYKHAGYAIHFNAKLMAEYLQKVGMERNIKTVVGKIEDAVLDSEGYVSEIILDTRQKLKTDFIFDCTGFGRFFVNKVYKSPVESYEEILPVKKAMPFFLNITKPTPPYTEATAMKYGWMWKIPVGDRYGCGYVFDSDLITDEEAYNEICEVTGQKPHVPRKLTFKSGYHTKPMNKNTLALGLSHGFLEPLEATSLLITIEMLNVMTETIPNGNLFNRYKHDEYTDDYNKVIMNYVKNCVSMVYIHYLTPRNDTEFWRNFKTNIPNHVNDILKKVNDYDVLKPNSLKFELPFNISNFLNCMAGVDYINKETIDRNSREHLYSKVHDKVEKYKYLAEKSVNHDEYLNSLTNISKTLHE